MRWNFLLYYFAKNAVVHIDASIAKNYKTQIKKPSSVSC